MFDDPAQYLKIEEAARLLGVSARTVYRWVWGGKLPASKVGGLYFIPRSELQKRLDEGVGDKSERQAAPGAGLSLPEKRVEPARPALKCGACFRLITSEAQIGELCRQPGCEQVLCERCRAEDIRYCAAHQPDRAQRLEQARQQLQRGEIGVLVSGETARLREVSFIHRIQARLSGVHALMHPVTGELINIPDWDSLTETSDERLEVMRLLGKVLLDAEMLARTPLNPSLAIRLPQAKGQSSGPVDVHVHALSRLKAMLSAGFDTRPFGAEELLPWLTGAADEISQSGAFRLTLLASATGWDGEARGMIVAGAPGRGFVHRTALFYLYDLEKGELIYNAEDERARPYAELFAPLLPSEELGEAVRSVEKELIAYQSLTLSLAAETLPYSKDVLRRAFERLAATGRFVLTELPDLGAAIVRL